MHMEDRLQRRHFLAGSIATTALALSREAAPEKTSPPGREYYQMRRYSLRRGPQTALTESYFAGALIPALGRMGMGPVGAFTLDIGPDTPIYYLLIPSASLDKLANLDEELSRDAEFMHAAAPFRDAPANAPAFLRVEVSLFRAFRAWPKVIPPASSARGAKRIFQLRTYESPS
ncbi:MAG: NIPSNAP family protein, partial [Acetobacteraceae bacterium]